jgi:glutamate racemase
LIKKLNKQLPIGVFDSGIGGLTVVRAIENLLPREDIYYYGDLAHLPYGSKGGLTVRKLAKNSADFLYEKGIKVLVVACNTATSIALPEIREQLNIPVVGVIEPGGREAVESSKNKRVGVIGTTRTIVSNAYHEIIMKLDRTYRVFQLATPLLVPLIEEGWIGHPAFYLILEDYLKFFDDKDIDTLVLGCTHYPLIKDHIRLLRPHWNIVDSAHATARAVSEVLEKAVCLGNNQGNKLFFASDISETFIDLSEKIMGRYIDIKLEERL